ncbi:MAG TPA: hypothetical protein PKZ22_00895 [Accumulibacter sp.]|nr:hypothetical protein [Accumulibacter sp.]
MNNHVSALVARGGWHVVFPILRSGLIVLFVALPAVTLLADEAADPASRNRSSGSDEQIQWMSGGIGDEARDAMRKMASDYNVHIVFSDRSGSYLATIPFSVAQMVPDRERGIYSGVSEGPLLYLRLSPGTYQIAAEINGAWLSRRIQPGTPGHPTKISFVAGGQ